MISDLQSFFSPDATWAGIIILMIIGLFIAAFAIGTVAHLIMPEKYVEQAKHRKLM